MIRLTARGMLFLGIAVFLYLASATSQSALLLLPIGILGGCYVTNWVVARQAVSQIGMQAPRQVSMAEGERPLQPWTVFNPSRRDLRMIRIDSSGGGTLLVNHLAPASSLSLVPERVPSTRGVYPVSWALVSSSAPFGFIKAQRKVAVTSELVVYPKLYVTHAPRSSGFEAMVGGKLKGKRRMASGHEFSGVRPHESGDPLKHIHWKSSAKGQGLMVKTFDEELAGRVGIISDGGSTSNRAELDDCLRAAGSLIFAALDAGDHVEWVHLDEPRLLVIPPFADGFEVLDRLARTELAPDCLNHETLRKASSLVSPRSALALVLTRMDGLLADSIAQLLATNRKISVYLPKGHPQPEGLEGVQWFNYSEAEITPCA